MFVLALALPRSASAHELPKGLQLLWPPGSAADALPVVLTNRGLIFPVEGDAEHAFALRCNEAYGVTTAEVPAVAFDATGERLIVGTSTAVSLTADQACSLEPKLQRTDIEEVLGSFVVRRSEPPEFILATQDATRPTKVLTSSDYGASWDVAFTNEENQLFLGLLTAPSDASRVYATGLAFERSETQTSLFPLWARSDDAGRSFTSELVSERRSMVGVHPADADVVFVSEWVDPRQTALRLLRSEDGGANFSEVLQAKGKLVLTGTPDGQTLWLGSDYEGGLYRSSDGGKTFEQVLPELVEVDCAVYRHDALYLCANREGSDAIWKLRDGESKLEPVLRFEQVTRAVACEDAAAASVCRVPWHDWQLEVLDPTQDEPDAGVVPDDAGPDAGGDEADAGVEPDSGLGEPASGKRGGGGCSLAPQNPSSHVGLGFLWLLGTALVCGFRGLRRPRV